MRRHFKKRGGLYVPDTFGILVPRYRPHYNYLLHVPTAASSFTWYGATFDGTNDFASRGADLDGIADGQSILFNTWMKMGATSSNTTSYRFFGNETERFQVYRHTDGQIVCLCRNSSDTTVAWFESNANSVVIATGWAHVLITCDTSTAGRRHIHINGTEQTNENTFTVGSTIDLAGSSNWRVGYELAGGSRFNGILCETAFGTPAYYDTTVQANREKFRTAAGKPEDFVTLGAMSPLAYFHSQVPNWHVNAGSGGGFTLTGTLVDSGADTP